jgi:DNA-binding CsgD family transcriptional regulator
MTVLFNDPLPTDDPAGAAVRVALAMRETLRELVATWRREGHALDFGIGVDVGYATLGTIGFAGRSEYGAIGTVVHVSGRLCDAATNGEILISQRVRLATEDLVDATARGEQVLPGLTRPVDVFAVDGARGSQAASALQSPQPQATVGPLTEREREVVELIVRGYTNRQIAAELIIAEGTAVRHVANILGKLELKSRAQVAVWAYGRK